MKKIKKKYNAVILGSSLTGLIIGALMAKHGAKILVVEKNNYFGGRFTPFSRIIEKNKYSFENDFCGFAEDNVNFDKILFEELKLQKSVDFIRPKYKITVRVGKIENSLLNNKTSGFDHLKKAYPLNIKQISAFYADIQDLCENPLYLKQIISKYSNAYDYLTNFFADNIIKTFFSAFTFYNGLPLKKIDSGYFIKSLINNFYSRIVCSKQGNAKIIQLLIKEIKKSHGDYILNSKVNVGLISKNKISTFKIIRSNKTNFLTAPKYLIGLNFMHFINNTLSLKGNYLKNYKNIYKENLSDVVKLKIYIVLKNNNNINTILSSYKYLINEKMIDFINKYSLNVDNTILHIVNYAALKDYDSSINKTIKIEFLYSKKKLFQLINNDNEALLKQFKQNTLNIILERIYDIWPNIKKNIITSFIYDFENDIKEFSNIDLSYNGLSENKLNNYANKALLTPFHNCYIASKFGSPGGELNNAFDSAYNLYHAFDIKLNDYNFSLIDTLNYYEFFNLLQQKYRYHKKYKNFIIGFHFDNEISFLTQFTEKKLLVKRSTFDEAFSSDIYVHCNFATIKNILQKRSGMTRQVLTNNFRVKGGVWLLQRILRRCNMNILLEKDLNNFYSNINKITTTSKLSKELLEKVD